VARVATHGLFSFRFFWARPAHEWSLAGGKSKIMELQHFEMGFGESEVNINGTIVSPEQAMMIAVHILEYLGMTHTLTNVVMAKRASESKSFPPCEGQDSSSSIH
jgi:hypothetical protein